MNTNLTNNYLIWRLFVSASSVLLGNYVVIECSSVDAEEGVIETLVMAESQKLMKIETSDLNVTETLFQSF